LVAVVDAVAPMKRAGLAICAVLWLVAGFAYVVFEAMAAIAIKPTYSYAGNYISALGVPAWSPLAWLMNGAFYLQGAFFLTGAVMLVRAVGRRGALFLVLTAANAVGNFLVATVHGGSPLAAGNGTYLHGAGALMAILGGNAAIVAGSAIVARALGGGRFYRAASLLIAAVGFACLVMLMTYSNWAYPIAPVGVIERSAVYSIIAWQILSGVVLLAPASRSRA
jgi:hypothetical membrane protein